MKNCPFCKISISENAETCPYCQRILVERIYSRAGNVSRISEKVPGIKQSKNYFKHLNVKIKNLKWDSFKKYILVFIILILYILISLWKQNSNPYKKPISVIPNSDQNLIINNAHATATPIKEFKNFTSLPNGTSLSKNPSYFKGLGELKIDNGTSLDAIAKLVSIKTNKSVLTVYLKAKNTYNISKISNGNYRLFFNLGNDWNDINKAFEVNSSYEVFEENFDFTISKYNEGDYVHTQYATFDVTLNPIIGGQAKTEEVNAVEFGSY